MRNRFEELLSEFLDGEIGDTDRAELRALIGQKAGHRHRFIAQVFLSEMLAQKYMRMRSENAFMEGLTTRIIAECDGDSFFRATLGRLWISMLSERANREQTETRRILARPWTSVALAVAALLVVAFGVGIFVRSGGGARENPSEMPALARIAEVRGDGLGGDQAGRAQEFRVGDPVHRGMTLETGSRQTIKLKYAREDTFVEMGYSSRVTFGVSSERGKLISLLHGRLDASIARQPEGMPFSIATPHAEVSVVGTVLAVTSDDTGTELVVREGSVLARKLEGGEWLRVGQDGRLRVQGGNPARIEGRAFAAVRELWLPADLAAQCLGLANDGALLWVSVRSPPRLLAVDPVSGEIRRDLDMRAECGQLGFLAWGDGALWAIGSRKENTVSLLKIVLPEGKVDAESALGQGGVADYGIACGGGFVLVRGGLGQQGSSATNHVIRLDPTTMKAIGNPVNSPGFKGARLLWLQNGLWMSGVGSSWICHLAGDGRVDSEAFIRYAGRGKLEFGEGDSQTTFWAMNYPVGRLVLYDALFLGERSKP